MKIYLFCENSLWAKVLLHYPNTCAFCCGVVLLDEQTIEETASSASVKDEKIQVLEKSWKFVIIKSPGNAKTPGKNLTFYSCTTLGIYCILCQKTGLPSGDWNNAVSLASTKMLRKEDYAFSHWKWF